MIDNQVVVVSNYATDALQKTLDVFAENDYKLVNANCTASNSSSG